VISCSHTTGYAIEALVHLARHRPHSVTVREIAESTGIPLPYLAKVFQRLADAGIVESKRGYKGGVRLIARPETITLLHISDATENSCRENPELCTRPGGFREAFRKSCRERLSAMTLSQAMDYENQTRAAIP
jgi:Rrf2 family protein